MDFNWVALIVALLGGGGLAVATREIVSVVTLARNGVSGKEDRRKADIVAQRDFYLTRAERAEDERDEAEAYYEHERRKRRMVEDALTLERRRLIDLGQEPMAWPDTESEDV
jgi:hypothetical protein